MIVESQTEPIAIEGCAVAEYRSLDELLRYWAQKRPNALALADTESRDALGAIARRSLTFAQAELAVNRLCARFMAHGLRPGDVLAVQLPNTVELALATLAAMRAGLVVSPLPLVWRKAELLRAFNRVPAKAIVTRSAFRQVDHVDVMRRTASAHVETNGGPPIVLFGFGSGLPEGVAGLDGALEGTGDDLSASGSSPCGLEGAAGEEPSPGRLGQEHPGLLSWGFDREKGPIAIARSRRELVAAGLMPALELELNQSDVILNPYSLSSLTGLAGAIAPWLITGASLLLHAPYDHEAFMDQIRCGGVTVALAPAPVLADIAGRDAFAARRGVLSRVLWVLPSPHSPAPSKAPFTGVSLFTVRNLREYALVTRRWADGEGNLSVTLGAAASAAPGANGAPLLETCIRSKLSKGQDGQAPPGELCVRGPSAPQGHNLQAGGARLKCDADGFVGTGIPCMAGKDANALICLPEPDLAYHGGVLIDIRELDRIYGDFPDFLDAAAFTIDDPVMGERIFAAVVPLPGAAPGEPEFRAYLESLEISPVKFPEKLVVVSVIPRDAQGRVLRGDILSQL